MMLQIVISVLDPPGILNKHLDTRLGGFHNKYTIPREIQNYHKLNIYNVELKQTEIVTDIYFNLYLAPRKYSFKFVLCGRGDAPWDIYIRQRCQLYA